MALQLAAREKDITKIQGKTPLLCGENRMKDGKFLTMAFESSCDETSVAIVADGREVLSNVISSQIDIFKNYGGVVPEIAARHHLENINEVVDEALAEAGVTLEDIDLIGVTHGPGLVGALLIGVATAKAIAYAADIPIIGVHHIMGHVSANFIEHKKHTNFLTRIFNYNIFFSVFIVFFGITVKSYIQMHDSIIIVSVCNNRICCYFNCISRFTTGSFHSDKKT